MGLLEVTVSSWQSPHRGDLVSIQKRDPGVPLSLLPAKGLVLTASEDSAALATELGFNFFPPLRMGRYFCCVCCFSVVGVDWDSPLQYLAKCSFFPGDYHSERPQAVSKLRLLLPNQKTVSNIILPRGFRHFPLSFWNNVLKVARTV